MNEEEIRRSSSVAGRPGIPKNSIFFFFQTDVFQISFIVQDSLAISRLRGVQIMVVMAVEKLVFRQSPD